MPTYEYECGKCEKPFEVFHRMDEPGPKKCPECGSKKIKRVIATAPAYHHRYSPMHPRATRGRGY